VQSDIRVVLPSIRVPTLILHHTDSAIPVANAHYAAEHIPIARYLELEGEDHLPLTHDSDRIAGEIEEFLTGARGARRPNRMLATIRPNLNERIARTMARRAPAIARLSARALRR